MARRGLLVVWCLLYWPFIGLGSIVLWEGNANDCRIDQDPRAVTILRPGTFKLEARDDVTYVLTDIDHITVDPACPAGQVIVYVVRNPDEVGGQQHQPGAANLKEINLTAPNPTGTIVELNVAGNLGMNGATRAASAGTLTIGGDLFNNIEITHLTGPIVIEGILEADISCETLADLTVRGGTDLRFPPSITVGSNYSNTMDVAGIITALTIEGGVSGVIGVSQQLDSLSTGPDVSGISLSGQVTVGGCLRRGVLDGRVSEKAIIDVGRLGNTLADTLTILDNMDGKIKVRGSMYANALVAGEVHGDLTVDGTMPGWFQTGFGVWGNITVSGNANGFISVGLPHTVGDLRGQITIKGDLQGAVYVWGDLQDASANLSGGHIIVDGSFTSGAALVVTGELLGNTTFIAAADYDGYDPADRWQSGAVVWVHGVPYYRNSPANRIWEVTACKTDLNNNHNIGFDDIDPFVLALSDPQGYALAYPGLGGTYWDGYAGGSMVFHGDLNCDGALDFLDIDPFVQRITEGCCEPTCGHCTTNAGAELGPQQLAVELRAHIAPQRYGDLVTLAGTAAHALPDPDRRAYWQAVYAALTK